MLGLRDSFATGLSGSSVAKRGNDLAEVIGSWVAAQELLFL